MINDQGHKPFADMDNLHRLFQEAIRKELVPTRVLAAIVAKKLKTQGIRCSARRSMIIGEQLAESLRSGAPSDGMSTIVVSDGTRSRKTVELRLSAEDIEMYAKDLGEGFGKQMLPMAEKIAKLYLSSVRRRDYEGMRARREDLEKFRKNLGARWGKAFDSYESFLAVAIDAGSAANKYLRSEKGGKPGALVDAMVRIHARAVQVAGEVLTLLESGYADGAHARWRTLHELAVVAALLSEHDDELAERYLQHEVVESLSAARQLKEYAGQIGEKPLPKREFEKLVRMEKALQDRFGHEYSKRYGWAAKLVNNPNPNFDHLEKAASFNHLRPYYKLASYNVHATSKGANYRLGLLGPSTNILLAGPSNAGLEDPGRFAAHSLLTITLGLLTIDTTLDSLVYGQMLVELYGDLNDRFVRAAERLRTDEARLSRRRPGKQE
ncbi:MAG: DUF5677 domain-containing protein [Burkholderiales bacterium]